MNKSDLVDAIAATTNEGKTKVAGLLDAVLQHISGALQKGDKVTLPGFGTFETRKRQARSGRNPRTGAPVKIAATTAPVFKARRNAQGIGCRQEEDRSQGRRQVKGRSQGCSQGQGGAQGRSREAEGSTEGRGQGSGEGRGCEGKGSRQGPGEGRSCEGKGSPQGPGEGRSREGWRQESRGEEEVATATVSLATARPFGGSFRVKVTAMKVTL